jgi:DNA-binding response OmpR family regulator
MVGADVAAPARKPGGETAKETPGEALLDVAAQELVLPSGHVGLTTIEFGVIKFLSERPGKAVSRYDLMEAVWGHRNPNSSNVVDVVIRSLRKKLGSRARTLETVRGTGYRYRPPG